MCGDIFTKQSCSRGLAIPGTGAGSASPLPSRAEDRTER
ncbi:hypothetical protein CASFOL_002611 [Castilleja foliolosa]|uniref:Uncharacterized protein n=1 Tax=Castilleja foliolosa TaxID=1961234 RepID=A0ABD3EIJ2_9LAMI